MWCDQYEGYLQHLFDYAERFRDEPKTFEFCTDALVRAIDMCVVLCWFLVCFSLSLLYSH
jgi:hypothetical protein